jgi:hypothetical protein
MHAIRVQKFVTKNGKKDLRYVVFAERNSKNLQQGIRSLYAAWDRLRRSVRWKRKVRGSIAVLEVTYNKKKQTWHPHLNVLFEGEYFPFEELRQAWTKATLGRGRTAHIKRATPGTEFELIKYTLKIVEEKQVPEGKVYELLIDDPLALDEFLSAVYGVRRIRTYGTFRLMNIVDEDGGEIEVEKEICPDCGTDCWIDAGPVSRKEQIEFDFEKKVFRAPCASLVRGLEQATEFGHDAFRLKRIRGPEDVAMAVEARKRVRVYEASVARQFAA